MPRLRLSAWIPSPPSPARPRRPCARPKAKDWRSASCTDLIVTAIVRQSGPIAAHSMIPSLMQATTKGAQSPSAPAAKALPSLAPSTQARVQGPNPAKGSKIPQTALNAPASLGIGMSGASMNWTRGPTGQNARPLGGGHQVSVADRHLPLELAAPRLRSCRALLGRAPGRPRRRSALLAAASAR